MVGVLSFGRGLFDREPIVNGNTSYKFFYRLDSDHFVMSQLFGWEGALALSSEDFAGKYLSPQFPTFRCIATKLDRRFLWWVTRRVDFWNQLGKKASGMGDRRRTLTPDALLTSEIPLPPLTNQHRIVARIEAIAGKIEEARGLKGEAEKEADALSYALLRQVRQRLLSSSFPKARLGSVTRVTAGGTPSRENLAYWDGDIPWIKTGELLDGDILNAEEKITQVGVDNSSAKLFPPDTVLIALYGQGQTRGRTGRLLIPATTNQACCAVLPQPELLDPLFVQFWLKSHYVELREQAQGGAQPNWNSAMIKNLVIAIPRLDEQRGIVAELGALRAHVVAFESLQAETRVGIDAMVPAVLDMAFRGEM